MNQHETMRVVRNGKPVLIRKSDFNPETEKEWDGKPIKSGKAGKAEKPSEPTNTAPAANEPVKGAVLEVFSNTETGKHLIVLQGEQTSPVNEMIKAEGYDTPEQAWAVIAEILKH